jgi:hypothetical protein
LSVTAGSSDVDVVNPEGLLAGFYALVERETVR